MRGLAVSAISGLAEYFKFDETAGTMAADSSGKRAIAQIELKWTP